MPKDEGEKPAQRRTIDSMTNHQAARQIDLTSCSPEQLAAGAQGGRAGCFEELLSRFGPRVLRYLQRRTGDAHEAEDLLQETFLRVFRALDSYDSSRSFAPWLFTIATRLAATNARKRPPEAPRDASARLDASDAGPLEALELAEQRRDLWSAAFDKLPPDQSAALWLRYAGQLSVAEVAETMGKSPGNVKVLLHRGRRQLTSLFAPAANGLRGADEVHYAM